MVISNNLTMWDLESIQPDQGIYDTESSTHLDIYLTPGIDQQIARSQMIVSGSNNHPPISSIIPPFPNSLTFNLHGDCDSPGSQLQNFLFQPQLTWPREYEPQVCCRGLRISYLLLTLY